MSVTADRGLRSTARPITYRAAHPEDLIACTRIWQQGLTDYQRRLNMPDLPSDLAPLERFLAHLLATDADCFWVAGRDEGPDEELVGFGAANVRGHVWFLSMLFVLPGAQAAGVGRALLQRTFPGGRVRAAPETSIDGVPAVLGTATDSAQPISNALYARLGIVPRVPVFHFVGRPERPDALPTLPAGVSAVPFTAIASPGETGEGNRELASALGAIDRAIVGYEHPEDHRFLRAESRDGWLYRGPYGTDLGYGYASAVGRIGPAAALDPGLLAPIVAHLLGAIAPRGASSLWIPGSAGETFAVLLRAGLRL